MSFPPLRENDPLQRYSFSPRCMGLGHLTVTQILKENKEINLDPINAYITNSQHKFGIHIFQGTIYIHKIYQKLLKYLNPPAIPSTTSLYVPLLSFYTVTYRAYLMISYKVCLNFTQQGDKAKKRYILLKCCRNKTKFQYTVLNY